jgi:2-dehydro-3-deoxyglucarate aldolase/4-hydroxy-2-oxoheptanedioate aldolase
MPDSLKTRVNRGDRLITYAVSRVFHHNLIQIIANHGGFDAFWIDVEHAGLTVRDIEVASLAGRAVGIECFVRLPPTDYASVTQCFESGAAGVMASQIESARHAEQFVDWCKFAPRGRRGLNNGGFDGKFGLAPLPELCERANREHFVAIQIETLQALEESDAIAAIDGVDLLFVGPADLSLALGVPGQFLHPKCLAAIDRVSAACRKYGKHWGAVTPTPEHAAMALEKGCTMLSPTNDVRAFNAGIKAVKEAFRDLF